jgi:hypothetical protein
MLYYYLYRRHFGIKKVVLIASHQGTLFQATRFFSYFSTKKSTIVRPYSAFEQIEIVSEVRKGVPKKYSF